VIPNFCIAHKLPQIAAHLYDALIWTPTRRNYETLTSVVAQAVYARLAPDPLVTISGYRKVVVRGSGQSHDTLSIAQCDKLPRVEIEPRPGFDFLIVPHNFWKIGHQDKDIKGQWCRWHTEVDWHASMALAIEMGIFTATEVRALGEEPMLIEGGFSAGTFPSWLVRNSLAILIPFYDEYARRYGERIRGYDPVQRRCLAFMAERLETHFILKELRRRYPNGFPDELFGCLLTVNDGPWTAGTMP
jgi:hypothetical protein